MTLFRRPRIAIIGAGTCSNTVAALAEEVGSYLAKRGYDIVCGGLGGVMKAASKGCYEAGGNTIGILPGKNLSAANPYISFPVATGLGNMRNALVVGNASAVIAIDGEYGTLSEIALALKTDKKVIVIGHWSQIDGTIQASDATEAVAIIQQLVPTDSTYT
ncbi:MAG: TIGR00725 family protein [Desulfovibrionales bacterium]|nr:TIGR00725 family protein [Desulfovibrionales bacterium]